MHPRPTCLKQPARAVPSQLEQHVRVCNCHAHADAEEKYEKTEEERRPKHIGDKVRISDRFVSGGDKQGAYEHRVNDGRGAKRDAD